MTRARKTVRLACVHCDIGDYDGITRTELAELVASGGWSDIEVYQSYEESIQPSPPAPSVLDWQTHYGVCPECRRVLD